MNKVNSFTDYDSLTNILNANYGLNIVETKLHREMIGFVYFLRNNYNKYVLKIYRDFNSEQAMQSINIINYLKENNFSVVNIVPTISGDFSINISLNNKQFIGILYDFIEGTEPNIKENIDSLGLLTATMHQLMVKYPKPLISRSKDFYIDRYIEMLNLLNYDEQRIADLKDYGNELWSSFNKLPNSFCHGDLHSGNMLRTKGNDIVLFDFDVSSNTYSIIDVCTLSNETHFNKLVEESYDGTLRLFERFYQGYSKKRNLTNDEIYALFDFVAIRHYELIATITECEGINSLSTPFINQQYEWLMKWRNICINKRNNF